MVSPNEDDLMSQVFASVQLPEVKWTSESHETHEVIRKTVTVNENGEQHVHTEHYHYNNHNGDEHESEDEHHHVEHSDNHGYHGKADEDLVSQVFFNRPTVETFRVENGVPESDDASERSSSRMSHHSHHSRQMSGSEHNHGHHILAREQELENGHLSKKVLETVPHKSQQQDSIIAELKKQQSGLDDSSSDDETLKGDDDEDHTRHEEMWHHEPHEEEHIVHYEMPPHDPPRDYESHRSSIAHSDHNTQQKKTEQVNYFNSNNQDNRSQRSNSVHSQASHHSYQVPPSHHSSHDSIPNYQPPPPPTQQHPATRDSRASSTSTLRSDRDIRIVTNHTPPAPPPQPTYDNGYDADEPVHHGDPKGIHTYREYGTRGHRRSNASEVSSVDYNRESFTVGDIEYIQEKPKARERTSTKQSSMNYNNKPPHLDNHQHYNNHQEQRFRTDTKQSGISHHHEAATAVHHYSPVKRQSYTPRGVVGHFVPSVDDSPIAPVSHLADHYGGRRHANKALFFPQKHEEAERIEQHHSRASSKRGSDVSSVHSLKHIGNKNERSNTQHSQHSVSSQAAIGKGVAHKRRDSESSVGTQHTAVVDKHPGKYDSVRVVKNVRSYKEFLDVWSQREIEEATEEGPIHSEPIPRPRYSISARHVYPDSLKAIQQPKQRPSLHSAYQHNASLRPSEHLNEHSTPGKVDKATSYHNLHLIGDDKSRHSTMVGEDKSRRSTFVGGEDKSRKSTFIGEQKSRHSTFVPIQEEDEVTEIHHHHHYHINGGTESIPKSRKSTLKQNDVDENHHHHHENDDEYDVDIHHLRSVFEHDNQRVKSRRASVQSTASGKSFAPIPIVPASHRQPYDNGLLYSRRRR